MPSTYRVMLPVGRARGGLSHSVKQRSDVRASHCTERALSAAIIPRSRLHQLPDDAIHHTTALLLLKLTGGGAGACQGGGQQPEKSTPGCHVQRSTVSPKLKCPRLGSHTATLVVLRCPPRCTLQLLSPSAVLHSTLQRSASPALHPLRPRCSPVLPSLTHAANVRSRRL